jgi:hypothetical protein
VFGELMAGPIWFRAIVANFVSLGSPVRPLIQLLLDRLFSLSAVPVQNQCETVGRTAWVGARPLPTQDNTKVEKILAYIHASNGIRTHDLSIQKGDDTASASPRAAGVRFQVVM